MVLTELPPSARAAGAAAAAAAGQAATGAALAALLAASVSFAPVGLAEDGAGGVALRVACSLRALRPFDARADLVLRSTDSGSAGGGGVWRAPLRVTIAPAPPSEQVLVLESPALGVPVSASVALANDFPAPAPFTAAFSLDTPPEFAVAPAAGVLPSATAAAAARGTGSAAPTAARITVTFTPRQYGVPYSGRLVVDTAGAQWAYRVEGRVAEARAPSGVAPRVADQLSRQEAAALAAAHTATRR